MKVRRTTISARSRRKLHLARFVSMEGPDQEPVRTLRGGRSSDVRFITSVTTRSIAKRRMRALHEPNSETSIFIYERVADGESFRLWQIEPHVGPNPHFREGAPVSYDLFRVSDDLRGKPKARAKAVANVLDKYGQQPPPTNIDPR